MIRFACATCGEKLSVPDGYARRKGICPNCRTVNRVPSAATEMAAGADAPTATATEPARPARQSLGRWFARRNRVPDDLTVRSRSARSERATPVEWEIDKGGLSPVARLTLLVLGITALVGLIWLFFYALIRATVLEGG